MPVNSVQMPNRQSNGLDQLGKVLGIINAAYGIKTDYERSKLMDLQTEEHNRQLEREKNWSQNKYTEGEASNKFMLLDNPINENPGVQGAIPITIVTRARDKQTGKVYKDPEDNTKDLIISEERWAVPKEILDIQSRNVGLAMKNQELDAYMKEKKILDAGKIPSAYITKGKIKNFSTKPQPGAWQTSVVDEITNKETPIWLTGDEAKPLKNNMTLDGTAVVVPDWAKGETLQSGYVNALKSGIQNPNPDDAYKYSPKMIQESKDNFVKRIDSSKDLELYAALKNFDDTIGINGPRTTTGETAAVSSPIPGLETYNQIGNRWGGFLYNMVGSDAAQKNQSAIQGIVNILLSKRSGSAVTPSESERLARELNAAAGKNNPTELRAAMGRVRDTMKKGLQNFEFSLVPLAKEAVFKEAPLHSESPLFQKNRFSDEQAARNFLKGQ
jgi:hypothetical protein